MEGVIKFMNNYFNHDYSQMLDIYSTGYATQRNNQSTPQVTIDQGPNPFIIDIAKATINNDNFRTTLWTGPHLQLTVMSIPVGEDIGLEVHPNVDQFIRIEQGYGMSQLGDQKDHFYLQQPVFEDSAIFVPAGTWHNIVNLGNIPLKLYTIYAPANHPKGTIHKTKAIAEAMERNPNIL